MEKNLLDRINELAKKSKQEGLTEEEKKEQKILRDKYICAFRESLTAALDQVVLVDDKGIKTKLKRSNTPKQ